MDFEKLYARLPLQLQNMAIGFEGWRIARKRFDRKFRALLEDYEKRSFWSASDIGKYRDLKLAAFISNSAAITPYYCALFKELGINSSDIQCLVSLKKLPILLRSTVRDRTAEFTAKSRGEEIITAHTSGTTGGGLRFAMSLNSHREQWAVWWRYRGWHGINTKTDCLYFGGRSVVPMNQTMPPFWRYNRPWHQILFSGYHLSEENSRFYLEEIRRSGAEWIHGYPSLISLLASYALSFNTFLPMKWVTLGAESLLPHQAELIRRAFGVFPIEHYGMAEGVANISLCPKGALHVDEDFSAVEFMPVDGNQYRIVGTNFSNPAFPLLRYDTGDIATVTGRTCDCGRPGRVVDCIDGRQEDYVLTKSGVRLGRLDHIFKDLVNVREAQIEQTVAGQIRIKVVKGPEFCDIDEKRLRVETEKRVSREVEFEIVYVPQLPRTKNGKLRLVVSSLKEGQIQGQAS
jgi:phenylacetate-CoA ligase